MMRIYAHLERFENALSVRCLPVRRQRTRWEEDNIAPLNVAAFVVLGAIVLGIAGLVLAVALT
jgi:hypothetical protein